MNQSQSVNDLKNVVNQSTNRLAPSTQELSSNIQACWAMCLLLNILVAGITCQAKYLVLTPFGRESPLSLFGLIIGKSGERKSAILKILLQVIYAWEEMQQEQHNEALERFHIEQTTWISKRRAFETELKRRMRSGLDTEDVEEDLRKHLAEEPKRPTRRELVSADETSASLAHRLAENGQGAMIVDEGLEFLTKTAIQGMSILTAGYDRTPFTRNRKGSVDRAQGPLTIGALMQPDTLEYVPTKSLETLAASGFLARLTVAVVEPTQGTRCSQDRTNSWGAVEDLHDRHWELLNEMDDYLNDPYASETVLQFTPKAAEEWVNMADEIERQILPGGRYQFAGDHASKLPENVARMAALIHLIEGHEGDISPDTLRVAAMICDHFSFNYQQVFAKAPPEIQDAIDLDLFFNRYREGEFKLKKNEARQYCPSHLRKGRRFYRALEKLAYHGVVAVFRDTMGAEWIAINPQTYAPE